MMTILMGALVFAAAAVTRWFLHRTSRREKLWCRGHVELTEVFNEGGAFSLAVPKEVMGALTALALAGIWKERKNAPIAAGLALGGGAANAWERLRHKRVYDYVRFPKAPGRAKRYVWNLADFAILAGAMGLFCFRKKK